MDNASSLGQPIHGVWRLIRTRGLSELGNTLPPPYGAEPHGIVQLHTNGRMMCVLADGSSDPNPSRAYLSYTGNYSIANDVLSTVVDASSNPDLIGKSQVRTVSLTADGLLTLTTPPVATDGDIVRREFTWEKLASST